MAFPLTPRSAMIIRYYGNSLDPDNDDDGRVLENHIRLQSRHKDNNEEYDEHYKAFLPKAPAFRSASPREIRKITSRLGQPTLVSSLRQRAPASETTFSAGSRSPRSLSRKMRVSNKTHDGEESKNELEPLQDRHRNVSSNGPDEKNEEKSKLFENVMRDDENNGVNAQQDTNDEGVLYDTEDRVESGTNAQLVKDHENESESVSDDKNIQNEDGMEKNRYHGNNHRQTSTTNKINSPKSGRDNVKNKSRKKQQQNNTKNSAPREKGILVRSSHEENTRQSQTVQNRGRNRTIYSPNTDLATRLGYDPNSREYNTANTSRVTWIDLNSDFSNSSKNLQQNLVQARTRHAENGNGPVLPRCKSAPVYKKGRETVETNRTNERIHDERENSSRENHRCRNSQTLNKLSKKKVHQNNLTNEKNDDSESHAKPKSNISKSHAFSSLSSDRSENRRPISASPYYSNNSNLRTRNCSTPTAENDFWLQRGGGTPRRNSNSIAAGCWIQGRKKFSSLKEMETVIARLLAPTVTKNIRDRMRYAPDNDKDLLDPVKVVREETRKSWSSSQRGSPDRDIDYENDFEKLNERDEIKDKEDEPKENMKSKHGNKKDEGLKLQKMRLDKSGKKSVELSKTDKNKTKTVMSKMKEDNRKDDESGEKKSCTKGESELIEFEDKMSRHDDSDNEREGNPSMAPLISRSRSSSTSKSRSKSSSVSYSPRSRSSSSMSRSSTTSRSSSRETGSTSKSRSRSRSNSRPSPRFTIGSSSSESKSRPRSRSSSRSKPRSRQRQRSRSNLSSKSKSRSRSKSGSSSRSLPKQEIESGEMLVGQTENLGVQSSEESDKLKGVSKEQVCDAGMKDDNFRLEEAFKSCLRALGYDLPMVEEGQIDPKFTAILDLVDPNREKGGVPLQEHTTAFVSSS